MPSALHRYSLALFVACMALLPASAQDAPWLRLETDNFELLGNAAEPDLRNVAADLERFRSAAHRLLEIESKPETPKLRVVVFRDAASFRPFKPKLADGTPDDVVAGFFQSGDPFNYIVVSADNGSFDSIYHEYTHLLVTRHFSSEQVRPWLNEGLAEYLQQFRALDARTAEVGRVNPLHLGLLRRSKWMPWDEFFKLDNQSLLQAGRHSRTIFYAQAWALMRYLIERRPDGTRLGPLVRELANAPRPVTRLLGSDIATLDAAVKSLIQSPEAPKAITVASTAPSITAAATGAGVARTNAFLGELLYIARDPAAETYLNKAIAADPANTAANGTLGLLRVRERRFAEAKPLLEKALTSDQANYRVPYYHAYLISREHTNEFGAIADYPKPAAERMRQSLRSAMALKPDFPEAHRLYAMIGAVTGDDLEASLAAAKRAVALEPSDLDYALLEARLLLRLERIDDARVIADRVGREAKERSHQKDAAEIVGVANAYARARRPQRELSLQVDRQSGPNLRFVKWADLTPDEIARIEEGRVNNNVNMLLERPAANEKLAVGYITRMTCLDGQIVYRVRTDDGQLRLTGRKFDDLKLKVLTVGTSSFGFRCNGSLDDAKAVLRYRPAQARTSTDGVLLGVTFVPGNFRLRSLEEIAAEPFIIIEGGPSADLEANSRQATAEREQMERTLREQQMRDIEERMRVPEDGESRALAVPSSIACSEGSLLLTARSEGRELVFRSPVEKKIDARSFTPEIAIVDLSCRATPADVPAVITYRNSKDAKGRHELVSIEFVPRSFRLN